MKIERKKNVSIEKVNTDNTNQSMNQSNNDLSKNQRI